MFKLLKWDTINFSKKYFWTLPVLGFLTVLMSGFYLIPPSFEMPFSNRSVMVIRAWIQLCIIALTLLSVSSWTGKTTILESSLSVPPWKQLLSKMILSIMNCCFYFAFSVMIYALFNSAGSQSVQHAFDGLNDLRIYPNLLLYSAVTLISFIITGCFRLTRRHPVVFTGIIYIVLTRIYNYLFDLVSPWSYQHEILIIVLIAFAVFAAGSLLYKYLYQQN